MRVSRAPSSVRGRIVRSTVVGTVVLAALVVLWRRFYSQSGIAPVHVSAALVIGALAGAGIFLVGRALRFHALLGGRLPLLRLLGHTGVSWGAGLVLPGPSADAAFIVLTRPEGISVKRSTGVAVLGRLFDVISLAAVILVVSAFGAVGASRGPLLLAIAAGAAALIAVAALLATPGRRVTVGLLERIARTRNLAQAVDTSLAEVGDRRALVVVSAGTVICRLGTLLEYWALFQMVGVPLSIWGVWFVLAVRTFLSVIPVQGVFGLGTGQLWWTGGLVLAQIPASAAVGVSITLSLLDLGVSAPLVAGCWALLHLTRPRESSAELAGESERRDAVEVDAVAPATAARA